MAKKGRPASAQTIASRFTAKQILDDVDQQKMWTKFLYSEDEKISLDAWKYLNDRVHGKPKQAVENTGPDGGPIEIRTRRVVVDV